MVERPHRTDFTYTKDELTIGTTPVEGDYAGQRAVITLTEPLLREVIQGKHPALALRRQGGEFVRLDVDADLRMLLLGYLSEMNRAPVAGARSTGEIASERRECVFCGTTPCTREHVLANKWHDRYPESSEGEGVAWGWGVNRRSTFEPMTTRSLEGQSAFDQTVKVVCAPCNNGWMSRLEDEAEPTLMDLHKSLKRRYRPEELAALVRWMTKTTIMNGQVRATTYVLSPEQNQALRAGQVPPGVIVAAYRMKRGFVGIGLRTSYTGPLLPNSTVGAHVFSVGQVVFRELLLQCVLSANPVAFGRAEPRLRAYFGNFVIDPTSSMRLPPPGPAITTVTQVDKLHADSLRATDG